MKHISKLTIQEKLKTFKMGKEYCKQDEKDKKLEYPQCSICSMDIGDGEETILLLGNQVYKLTKNTESNTFGWIRKYFRMMDFVRQNPMLVKRVDKSEFVGENDESTVSNISNTI